MSNEPTEADVEVAITGMAEHLIASLVEDHAGTQWESFPDIGEDDWMRVVARAEQLAEDNLSWQSHYQLLAARAGESS